MYGAVFFFNIYFPLLIKKKKLYGKERNMKVANCEFITVFISDVFSQQSDANCNHIYQFEPHLVHLSHEA